MIDTVDYIRALDTTTVRLSRNDAHLPASVVDDHFYMECMSIVRERYGATFDLYRDITVDNSLDVYLLLLTNLG